MVGGRGWRWSPAHSWGGGKDGTAGGGGIAAEAALGDVRPMDLVPLLNLEIADRSGPVGGGKVGGWAGRNLPEGCRTHLPEPIPESSGVVVLMQHFLESELGGLEQVRVPRPRHELGSTISAGRGRVSAGAWAPCQPHPPFVVGAPYLVILRVLEVQRAAVVRWLLQEVKGQRPAACSAPRGTSQECSTGEKTGHE